MINLFRAIFPRWNFFDQITHRFELEYKTSKTSQWQKISFDQKRALLSPIINPSCNLALAQINIIEHFVSDLEEGSRTQTSYKLLLSLVKIKLSALGIHSEKIQFQVVAVLKDEREIVFTSEEVKV
jgi:hypothetical protein